MGALISIEAAIESAERQLEMVLDGSNWTPCSGMVPLTVPVEWGPRFCNACHEQAWFMADRVCISGLVARCGSCGDQIVAPFTRATGEAA